MTPDSIDIDSIEVKIVILAKNAQALQNVGVFLQRRGWPTVVFGQVSEAVTYIQENKPDFVLISFNHANPSIHKIPELIQKKFDVACVGYVEGTDAISADHLTSAKVKHKIFGHPTGPNIYRGIRRILAEMLEVKHVDIDEKSLDVKAESSMQIISGDRPRLNLREIREEKRTGRPSGTPLQQQQVLLSRAFKNAFAGASATFNEKVLSKEVTRVGVFPVNSSLTPGYIVVTPPNDPGSTEELFLRSCEGVLQGALQTSKLPVKMEAGFWMDVPKVNFYDWAQKNGAFTLKQSHQGSELGMSFMQSEKPLPEPRVAREKDMYSLSLDEISPEVPVNFSMFLHLRHNKKFYLYLRPGRYLQLVQKMRLKNRNVKNIYVKTADLKNLKKFLAEVCLKQTFTDKAA